MGKRNTAFHRADIQDIEQDLLQKCEAERLGVTPSTASTDLFYLDSKGNADAPHAVAERNRAWKLGELAHRILKAHSAISIQPQRMRPSKGRVMRSVTRRVGQKGMPGKEEPTESDSL